MARHSMSTGPSARSILNAEQLLILQGAKLWSHYITLYILHCTLKFRGIYISWAPRLRISDRGHRPIIINLIPQIDGGTLYQIK